jgi:hypothetical protein
MVNGDRYRNMDFGDSTSITRIIVEAWKVCHLSCDIASYNRFWDPLPAS